ncbi:MAG: RNA methyltransferase [Alphaproteobacteria bacterium]
MLDRLRVVLVRPRRGGNVGSVARAMKNMGLGDLVVVAPRTKVGRVGARMAVHAVDVLDRRRTVATLADAVADCRLVVGTVGRPTTPPDVPVAPREIAREMVGAAGRGRVAIVFGPEDHGLSNAELGLCQRSIRIPTAPGYPSLNLAQAVAVCTYEILLAHLDGAGPAAATGASAQPATASEREEMLLHLSRALGAIGFLSGQNPDHILRDVRSLFARAGTTSRDVRVWRGVARQVLWVASRAGLDANGRPAGSAAAPGRPRTEAARLAAPRVSPRSGAGRGGARSAPGSRSPRPSRPRSR